MIRLEVTKTELTVLRDLLDAQRNETRRLIIKDGSLSSLLTRTDGLMERINMAIIRNEPKGRIKCTAI